MKDTPAAPAPAPAQQQQPQSGGQYVAQPDGTLKQVGATAPATGRRQQPGVQTPEHKEA